MELIQLLIGGVASGCIYGLVALGFVLIYKASEGVNFAQGDMMMLGAFVALGLVNRDYWALPFIPGIVLACVIMGGVGYGIDRFVVRRIFGQPQFALVILTIALGFVLRFVAGAIWGFTPLVLETPFAGKHLSLGGLVLGYEDILTICVTAVLTLGLWAFFSRTKTGAGRAGRISEPDGGLYRRRSRTADKFADLGAVRHRRDHCRGALCRQRGD